MTFTLLPAVDVSQGQAVRLDKGEAGTETSYGSPRDAAQKWQSQGAHWLHFVDLDAAFGRGSNHEEMAMITRELALYVNEGIDSAIIGKALYEGNFTLDEALAAVAVVEPLPAEETIDPFDPEDN